MTYFARNHRHALFSFWRSWLCLSALLFSFSTTLAMAQDSPVEQSLSIAADTAEIDEQNGWAVYQGNVVLEQGDLLIQCQKLQIFRGENSIDKVVASGSPATYTQSVKIANKEKSQEIQAAADEITYRLESKSIELKGSAQIRQGENMFEGHSIVYQIENRKIIAQSHKSTGDEKPSRVRIVLPVRGAMDSKTP